MFVKICGITNREDALDAVDAGARAIGFVFYDASPRGVTAEAIKPWIDQIPPEIWKVGVFVNETPVRIEEIALRLKLDVAQLHGAETPENHPRGLRVWKAFRAAPPSDYPAEAILLDGPGSGRTFDWATVKDNSRPIIVAGGLTPENVAEAVSKTNPWGVDTASGVESSPGRKDRNRMKMFIKAALHS
ncbi:MAG: phosphoribosylanthranilate isomerase [Acidobacteriota bacterium]|nr:phosphoribosylanthranilate isomerase [Acidobacteriota bacterium]